MPSRGRPQARPSEQRRSLAEALEEEIIFGRLVPRERLVEDVLMARFGVKRHVVREALAGLEKLGLVERAPNRGASVRAFSPREVQQIFEMRELLQGHAAASIPLPADPALVEVLEALHARHGQAVERGDLRTVYHLNNEFHDRLFAACGNPYLADTIKHFAWLAHAIRSYRIADPALLAQARHEHGQMIEALRGGDRAALVRLCVDHIKPSRDAYLRSQQPERAGAAR